MSPETTSYFERLISTYTDNIRASDFRSNILIFFLSLSISTVTAFRAELPRHVPILILLIFPLCSIILLILSIYPRHFVVPGYPFYVSATIRPDAFPLPAEDDETTVAHLRNRCVVMAKILYWKMYYFRIAVVICLVYLTALLILAICGGVAALA